MNYTAILRGVWRRHKTLMVGIYLGIAIPFLYIVNFTVRPLYLSKAMISIEPSVVDQLGLMREQPGRDVVATHMVLLKSQSLGQAVIEALPRESFNELLTEAQYTDYWLLLKNTVKGWLGKPLTILGPQERAIAELQKARMEFLMSKEAANVVIIQATATKPRVATDLVNTHIQVLLSRTRSVGKDESKQTREFLEQQYQRAKENLTRSEEALASLQQKKGRIGAGGQRELDLVRFAQIENALAETQATRQVLSTRIEGLRRSLDQVRFKDYQGKGDEARAASLAANNLARANAFKAAQEQLAATEAKLAALRGRYTEANPLVQIVQEDVNKQQVRVTQMARELPTALPSKEPPSELSDMQGELASLEKESKNLEAKEETLNLQLARLRSSDRGLSQGEAQFENLRRSVDANRGLVTVLSDKLMATRMREQGEPSVVRIVDPASIPPLPTESKTQKLVVMVLALAGCIAFGAAFGLEAWRQPIETETDIHKATGLRVLGSVGRIADPKHGGAQRPKDRSRRLPLNLFTSSRSPDPHLELYRKIRATVETQCLEVPFRSILITSPGPNEGKSTTVLNLAHSFHEIGRRVVVVEADLRRPAIYRTLSVPNSPGLQDFLNGSATFDQVCRPLPSGITVIPGQVAGGKAASLLASPRMRQFLDLAERRFDLVLVDTPPVLAVSDDLLLVTAFERVILVVKASATSKRDLQNTISALNEAKAGIGILGIILNQANPIDVPYYQARYRKYYHHIDQGSEVAVRRSNSIAGKREERPGPPSSRWNA